MGFIVSDSLDFTKFGVSASGCYVTIRATFSHGKLGAPGAAMYGPTPGPMAASPYTISARWYVYATNDTSLTPLREESIVVNCESVPANPIAAIYAAIKSQHFSGKTLTDDL